MRSFQTSTGRLDLFDFFKRRGAKEITETPSPQKTKEVMKNLESGESKINPKPVKLRVLGKPPQDTSWELENNGFAVNAWPMKATLPELDAAAVEQVMKEVFTKMVGEGSSDGFLLTPLTDLNMRFQYTKSLSRELGVLIPDTVLSNIENVGDIKTFLLNKVAGKQFDENAPDAIYLDSEEFEGLNITIRDSMAERQARKENYKKLLRRARASERAEQEKLLKGALEK